jgi:hypothetical protein
MRFTSHGIRCKQNNIIVEVVKQNGFEKSGGSGFNIKLISATILSRSEAFLESRYEIELYYLLCFVASY